MSKIKSITRYVFGTPKGNAAFALTIVGMYLSVSAFFTLSNLHITGLTAPCSFYAATGFLCPGCGGTRCIDSLLHFRPVQAFIYNPMASLIFAFVMAFCAFCAVNSLRKPYKPLRYSFRAWHIISFAAVYLFFFIMRNVFWFKIF